MAIMRFSRLSEAPSTGIRVAPRSFNAVSSSFNVNSRRLGSLSFVFRRRRFFFFLPLLRHVFFGPRVLREAVAGSREVRPAQGPRAVHGHEQRII